MASAISSFVLKRSFSTSNICHQLVKTPTQIFGIDGRYATALYSAAVKQKQLDKVDTEMVNLHKLYTTDAKFRTFVDDPTLKRLDKQKAVSDIAKKLGFTDVTQNFISVVAENGRLPMLENIVKSFQTMMSAHREEVNCEITTAKTLDAAANKELDKVLQAFAKGGKKLKITHKVDPSIIGGMIVVVGDRYVDMSLASKLSTYTRLVEAPV